jgi:hypothetical protein
VPEDVLNEEWLDAGVALSSISTVGVSRPWSGCHGSGKACGSHSGICL